MKNIKLRLVNARARMQRLKDAKIFNGWVTAYEPGQIGVAFTSGSGLRPGDRVRFEVYDTEAVASFDASATSADRMSATFQIATRFDARPGTEESRVRVYQVSGSVHFLVPGLDGEDVDTGFSVCAVVDVSPSGIGLLCPEPAFKGDKVAVAIQCMSGRVDCEAEVRYCKPCGSGYRLGLEILEMDRLSRAIYDQLLHRTILMNQTPNFMAHRARDTRAA